MSEIDFREIERKWQKKWEKEKIFLVREDSKKEKFYFLEMFPYPSGSGLHMGHALNYTIGDIFSRFKRMKGYNVLHPMGYDALGLPAENAAIKEGKLPEIYTRNSIKNFTSQLKSLGFSYDWSRVINTSSPKYYKWDQWIFLKMFERGLAYQKESAVNWCPDCKTVLANEQVNNGKCWRHDKTSVEVKFLKQWFFKITDYAEELLDKLNELDWPERTKSMQKHWIGKSYGTEINFEIVKGNRNSKVVIIHGIPTDEKRERDSKTRSYDKHWIPWIKKKLEKKKIKVFVPLMPFPWNPNYESWKKEFEKLEVNENSILIGHSGGCSFLVRWLGEFKKKIKKLILVAPWKIPSKNFSKGENELYNFEIDETIKERVEEVIIFTSDNEEKNGKESAKIYHNFLGGKLIELQNHGHYTLGEMGTEKFPELLEEIIHFFPNYLMIDKKKLSKEIEEGFEKLKGELGIQTSLEDLDSEFLIKDLIFSTGFVSENFLRQVYSRMTEYYRDWHGYLNNILLPNPSYLAGQTESKLFQSEEDKKKLWNLIKLSMKFSSASSLNALEQDKKKEAQFIDESYNSWIKDFKPGLLYILTKVSEAWDKE